MSMCYIKSQTLLPVCVVDVQCSITISSEPQCSTFVPQKLLTNNPIKHFKINNQILYGLQFFSSGAACGPLITGLISDHLVSSWVPGSSQLC